ncbi:MAG: GH1 family beta-glucosidase [Syntrophobacteraceae bacterium]|nr:GH1 family beta-glucosidase [Syntrophobacteraceae bacterium]
MENTFQFPDTFLWGCATAAYQIEGSPLAQGAGRSFWHRFSHTPGMTRNGDTGDIACDHYRRMEQDVALMADLGLNAYRFSISWARVLPGGEGGVNQLGLDFYDRLVDALLKRSITPMVTLYHWDLPEALDNRGGWLNPRVADWFAEYSRVCFRRLDDRVGLWVTLNEPWVVTDGGYLHGTLAPGHRNLFETPVASHNLLRSHSRAVQVYREVGRHRIGIVVNIEPKHPATDSAEDLAATERADGYMNRQYLEPVIHGRYPKALQEVFGEAWPEWPQKDLEEIRRPIDFIGLNYYTREVVRHDPARYPVKASAVRQPNATYTETGWEVYPPALTDSLAWLKENYGNLPIYITENGAAFYDPPTVEGERLEDPLRQSYLKKHIKAAHDALDAGVDLRGYFVWSLLDNLEWSQGYSKRFGLIHVDFSTQKRTRKGSADLYQQIIASNGRVLERV